MIDSPTSFTPGIAGRGIGKALAGQTPSRQAPVSHGYRFSHIAGTIFENTNKPLRIWYRVIHLMLTSKKGMSALQIYRYMGFGSYMNHAALKEG